MTLPLLRISRGLLRFFTPFGLVQLGRDCAAVAALGVPLQRALLLSINPQTGISLQRSRLTLLPSGALRNLECVVDAGANVGDWSAGLLRIRTPRRLLLIEPDPRLIPALCKRFNKHDSIEVVGVALGAHAGTVEFHLMKHSVMNSVLQPTLSATKTYPAEMEIDRTISVPVSTLDELTQGMSRIDLLKIDVQGSEIAVLQGARTTLSKTIHVLLEINFITHYAGESSFFELDDFMRVHGFSLRSYSPPHRGVQEDARALWADAVYSRDQPMAD